MAKIDLDVMGLDDLADLLETILQRLDNIERRLFVHNTRVNNLAEGLVDVANNLADAASNIVLQE